MNMNQLQQELVPFVLLEVKGQFATIIVNVSAYFWFCLYGILYFIWIIFICLIGHLLLICQQHIATN